jgi:hypothetical protein
MRGVGRWRFRTPSLKWSVPHAEQGRTFQLQLKPDPVLPVPFRLRPQTFRTVYSEITRAVTRGSLADPPGEEHDE